MHVRPPSRAAFAPEPLGKKLATRSSSRFPIADPASSHASQNKDRPSGRAFHAAPEEIERHLSSRPRSLTEYASRQRHLAPRESADRVEDGWLTERYAKHLDLPSADELIDLRREQAEALDQSDQRYLEMGRDLERLDDLARSVSGRRAAYGQGDSSRSVRLRNAERERDRRAPIDVPRADFLQDRQRLERSYQEELADLSGIPDEGSMLTDPENRWLGVQRDAIEARYRDRLDELAKNFPSWASSDASDPVRAYREVGGQARVKGRYPAQKPFEPHREARAAHEQLRERSLDGTFMDEAAFHEGAGAQSLETASSRRDIPGLLVPRPRRAEATRFDPSDYEDEV